MTEIRTARLTLRAIREEDIEDVLAILCDGKVAETYMLPDMSDPETALKLARRFRLLSEDPERFVYGVCLNDRVIGLVNEVDKSEDTIELGYVIRPDCWNKGYATEMLKAVIQALFARGWRVVRTGYFEENPASGRVMEKAGMHPIEHVDQVEYRGITHRCFYYEIQNR